MTRATAYEHVVNDEGGMALIAGTNMRGIELVVETVAYGWSVEELQFQHPYFSLGQIHSTLAYYCGTTPRNSTATSRSRWIGRKSCARPPLAVLA